MVAEEEAGVVAEVVGGVAEVVGEAVVAVGEVEAVAGVVLLIIMVMDMGMAVIMDIVAAVKIRDRVEKFNWCLFSHY